MRSQKPIATFLLAITVWTIGCAQAQSSVELEHGVVAYERGTFDGWPANNGLWTWDGGNEALVGFTRGKYVEQYGHGIEKPYTSLLARSTDGGRTWAIEHPKPYIDDDAEPNPVSDPIDFSAAGFAMRVVGDKYHAATKPQGEFFYSTDRGRSWQGPFTFSGLETEDVLSGLELTPRTDYRVIDRDSCLVFMSARMSPGLVNDRAFVARTDDGGKSWHFVNWIIAPDDPARAVMPATVQVGDQTLVTALRRRQNDDAGNQTCWVDVCISKDLGQTWTEPILVGDAGDNNGNPPSIAKLSDGRIAIVYANRATQQMLVRYSADQGQTWSKPIELRSGYKVDSFDTRDMGYSRLYQRPDGKLVAIYYWATNKLPEPHIECTIWRP